jgi:low temperature requirement protein LtrA
LWGLYFGRAERLAVDHVEQTSDPVRASRHAVNALTAIVAGLIAVAVGNEKAIAHPEEHGSATLSALLFGGPVLFLLAQAWYLRTVLRISARVQMIGCGVLIVLGTASLNAPAYVALTVAAACLVTLAIVDRRYDRR